MRKHYFRDLHPQPSTQARRLARKSCLVSVVVVSTSGWLTCPAPMLGSKADAIGQYKERVVLLAGRGGSSGKSRA